MRTLAITLVTTAALGIGALHVANAQGTGTQAGANDEGQGNCPAGKARACDSSSAFVACFCPPGTTSASPSASCAIDAKAKAPASCIVPDATIGDALGAHLELGRFLGSFSQAFAPGFHQRPASCLPLSRFGNGMAITGEKDRLQADVGHGEKRRGRSNRRTPSRCGRSALSSSSWRFLCKSSMRRNRLNASATPCRSSSWNGWMS